MRERLRSTLNREVTMPRWAIVLDFCYRVFLVVSAAVVLVLWWQAATRDEEADRNARIQSCTSVYAATYSAWDAEALHLDERAEALFARIIVRAAGPDPIPAPLLERYQSLTDRASDAADNADKMARLRIGLGRFAGESIEKGNDFRCPPIGDDLAVEGIEP